MPNICPSASRSTVLSPVWSLLRDTTRSGLTGQMMSSPTAVWKRTESASPCSGWGAWSRLGRRSWTRRSGRPSATSSPPERPTAPGPTPKHLCGGITFCGAVMPDGKSCGKKMKSAINSIKSPRTGERRNFSVHRYTNGGRLAEIEADLKKLSSTEERLADASAIVARRAATRRLVAGTSTLLELDVAGHTASASLRLEALS